MIESDRTAPGRIAGWIGIAVAILSLTLPSRQARGQAPSRRPEPGAQESRPWAKGVSGSEQALALEIYRAGNAEFAESRFAQALVLYREAVRHWDHPAIRYNMAICLIKLDRLVEAKDNLDRSLVYEEAPLGAEPYEQALQFRARLAAQLATVEIAGEDPGDDIVLDGQLLFKTPGAARATVMPGMHQIVASGPGLPTLSHPIVVAAGTLTRYAIEHKIELVDADIRHALAIEELATAPGSGPPTTAQDVAAARRPAAPRAPVRPGTPPAPLQAGSRPTSFTWEAGLGIASAWAHSGSRSEALFYTWRDLVAGTRKASMEWSDPITAWSFSLGAGRWVGSDVALSGRIVWTSFGFSDGTIFNVTFLGASLQYWLADHVWIGGGPGFAWTGNDPGGDDTHYYRRGGFGQDLRAGYTFNTSSKITINISAELTTTIFSVTSGSVDATMAVLLGVQRSTAPN